MRFQFYQNCWKNIPFTISTFVAKSFECFQPGKYFVTLAKSFQPIPPQRSHWSMNNHHWSVEDFALLHIHIISVTKSPEGEFQISVTIQSLLKEGQNSKYKTRPCQFGQFLPISSFSDLPPVNFPSWQHLLLKSSVTWKRQRRRGVTGRIDSSATFLFNHSESQLLLIEPLLFLASKTINPLDN